MSLSLAARNTIGVVLPLVAGFALGYPRTGLAICIGALNVSYSDGNDAYSDRFQRMFRAALMCSLAVFCGAIAGHRHVQAVIFAAAWAFIAGIFVSLGPVAGDIGVISLVTLIVYAAQPLTPKQAAEAALLALAGALLQIALSFASWPVRRYEPQRRALAAFFFELADTARRLPEGYKSPPATSAATQAQTAIASLATDNSIENLRYRSILTQAERIRISLMLLVRLRVRMLRESSDHPALGPVERYLEEAVAVLRAVAESLRTGGSLPSGSDRISHAVAHSFELRRFASRESRSSFFAATLRDAEFQMDALAGQLRSAADLASHASPQGARAFELQEMQKPLRLRFGGKLATLRANLNFQSAAFRHAIRLSAAVAIGEALGRSFDWRRSYWLPMTVVVVLKPEFTTTFSRGILRIAGTIAGLLLTTAALHFFPSNMTDEIILIALFMFLMRWAGPANYGFLATAVSALVVLLLAVYGVPPEQAIWARESTPWAAPSASSPMLPGRPGNAAAFPTSLVPCSAPIANTSALSSVLSPARKRAPRNISIAPVRIREPPAPTWRPLSNAFPPNPAQQTNRSDV